MKRFILRDSSVKGVACVAINALPQEPVFEVIIREYKKNRSLAQNNLLWMWLTEISKFLDIEHGIKCTPDNLKVEFQERFLGHTTYAKSDGTLGQVLRGTSGLNTAQFTDFMTRIEVYAQSELGCRLPHPEDMFYEAMGRAA